ncbi:hypothetical protein D3C76_1415930 [compost metagenome]
MGTIGVVKPVLLVHGIKMAAGALKTRRLAFARFMDMEPVFAGNKIEGLHLNMDTSGHLCQLCLAHLGAVCADKLNHSLGAYLRTGLLGLLVVRTGNGREQQQRRGGTNSRLFAHCLSSTS